MNLFADLPRSTLADEAFSTLVQRAGLRIERIVSTGQQSPPDFWYDQSEGEWVVVLSGAAQLSLLDPPETHRLNPGDHLDIAPHRRHRVDWTASDVPTVWLAVFYPDDSAEHASTDLA